GRHRAAEGVHRMSLITTSDPEALALPSVDRPSRGRAVKNAVATGLMWTAFLVAVIPLVWVLWTVVSKGYKLLLHAGWWTHSQQGITIRHEGGGAYHAIIGTLLQALFCAG